MICKDYYSTRKDGVQLYRSYSDKGVKLHKIGTNEVYDEAIDVETTEYVYEEMDIPVDGAEATEATEADYQAALQEMGVDV